MNSVRRIGMPFTIVVVLLEIVFVLCGCDEVAEKLDYGQGIFHDDPNSIYYDLAGVYELAYQFQATNDEGGGVVSVAPDDTRGILELGINKEVRFQHAGAKRFPAVDFRGTYEVFYGKSFKTGTLIMDVKGRRTEKILQFRYNWDDPNITLTEYVQGNRIMAYYFRRKIIPGQ